MSVFTKKIDRIILEEGIETVTKKINDDIAEEREDLVYPNQVDCALRLIRSFDDSVYPRSNHKIVEGLTQAGKTGVCKAAIEIMKLYKLLPVLNIKTIYYISGDNAKDMIAKNAKLISKCFKDDFGCDFKAMKNSTMRNDRTNETLTNAMIFIDEAHYGVESERNKLIEWLNRKNLDMHNNEDLSYRSVFIISNSATPFAEEMSDVAETKQVIRLHVQEWDGKPGMKYVGIKHYYQNGAFVENVRRDSIINECAEMRQHLDEIKARTGKQKVAIARIYSKRLNSVKAELEKYFKVYEYSQNTEINYDAMNDKMLNGPKENLTDKPIMIVVKGAYTMGNVIKTEAKKNIGAIFDVRSNCNGKNGRKGIVSTIQGLLGRITGYTDTDDWKDIRIWVHDDARTKMRGYYYEQASSTPITVNRQVFIPNDKGEIGILEAGDSITYYGVPEFEKGRTIKEGIIKYLENIDEKYKTMKCLTIDRYVKTNHMSRPYFGSPAETESVRIEDNLGLHCYSFLYDKQEHKIDVLYGTFMRGNYETVEDSNAVRVLTLLTEARRTFVPDPNGTEYNFVEVGKIEEYTNVPKFEGYEYKHDIVKYLNEVDREKFNSCTVLAARRNWNGRTSQHLTLPDFSRKTLETGRYGKVEDILNDENIGRIYFNFLYDLDEATIKVSFAKLMKGHYEMVYPKLKPVDTLKTTIGSSAV